MPEALQQGTFEYLYQKLRALPDGQRGEILAGELVVSPRPALPHSVAAMEISGDLWYRFHRGGGGERPGGWLILPEPELHLSGPTESHVVSPDIAGWKRERLHLFPDRNYLDLAPDWVCEVLSPSTLRYDRGKKSRIYHDSGVSWLWLVEPNVRTLEAFRREGAFWVWLGLWGEGDRARIEPFQEAEIDLTAWWSKMEA